jgi:hypothetical protein
MPFTIEDFGRSRSHLYHLTAPSNLQRIRRAMKLVSAAKLMAMANSEDWLTRRRRGHLELAVDGIAVVIRDQDPLHEGNVALQGGWTFVDLIRELNKLVFFWPGNRDGPVSYGIRHYERYRDQSPVILRLQLSHLVGTNDGVSPLFCRYNSGAPRCSNGHRSPRGPRTFVSAGDADFTPGRVVEVVFRDCVMLPEAIEIASRPTGPWRRMQDA